ncbi:CHAP domain-containing protein [Pseudarthrobacter raffinosi]|uniref:CHAP domain-containing protein n=1 Tax=Pseudarthrobacter raffinosi TaxID=2953651 RepID=UPI00208E1B09|nr:CHAP domain-containing protein [Pseudarthrobacter sp. MDT3-9]MCO4251447.1 CHAP domain-containing protein [Pseudarthrobacter sp. MDT3-9]
MTAAIEPALAGSPIGHFLWRLEDISQSRIFKRFVRIIERRIHSKNLDEDWVLYLSAICLVETSQRPLPVRFVERCCAPIARLWRNGKPITLGPLQLANAPFSFARAVDDAICFLIERNFDPTSTHTVQALATHWNGSIGADAGSTFSYSDALSAAISVLAPMHCEEVSEQNSNLGQNRNSDAANSNRGDDLPWRSEPHKHEDCRVHTWLPSPLGMYRRECTDFALWRLNLTSGVTASPWRYHNSALLLGDAEFWINAWHRHGWSTGTRPEIGSVAYFVPGSGGAGDLGHVAVVASFDEVNVTIEEYNFQPPPNDHSYGIRVIPLALPSIYLHRPEL